VRDAEQFTRVRTQDGKLLLDVEGPGETVHIACPLVTVEHLSDEIPLAARRNPDSSRPFLDGRTNLRLDRLAC